MPPIKPRPICQQTSPFTAGRARDERELANLDESEALALSEQVERLPESIASAVLSLMRDYEYLESPEARMAHDADRLECLLRARVPGARIYRCPGLDRWLPYIV